MLSFLRFSEALIHLFCSLVYNGSMPIESGFSCDSGEGFTLLLPLIEWRYSTWTWIHIDERNNNGVIVSFPHRLLV